MADHEKLYRDIGEFIVEFSQLEYVLRWTLTGVLEVTAIHADTLDAIASLFDFARLCTALQRLMKSLPPDKRPSDAIVDQTIKECRAINDERVRIVHGMWQGGGAQVFSRGNLNLNVYFRAPDDLPTLIQRTKNVGLKAMDLFIFFVPPKEA